MLKLDNNALDFGIRFGIRFGIEHKAISGEWLAITKVLKKSGTYVFDKKYDQVICFWQEALRSYVLLIQGIL